MAAATRTSSLFEPLDSTNNSAPASRRPLSFRTHISVPFAPYTFSQVNVSSPQQHLLLITAQEQSFNNRIFRLRGKKEQNGGPETQRTRIQIFKPNKWKSPGNNEVEGGSKFGPMKLNLGTKRGVSTIGGSVMLNREPAALSFVRPRRQNPKTVFVAGASGQIGARITQKLLREGSNVRGGVSDLYLARQVAEFAAQYGVINREEAKRLNAVEFDMKNVESIASAIGNAAKVVVTIGPTEDGPSSKVSIDDASRVVEAAKLANVAHIVVVYESDIGNVSGPFAGVSTFFNNLFNREELSPETQNLLLIEEGTTIAVGKVSKSQISSLVARVLLNTTVSENKIAVVTTSPSAPLKPIDELLREISVDGRRAALAEARAKAEKEEKERVARKRAEAEVHAAIEEARKAAERTAELEAETKKMAAEEAKAAAFAEKAKARAEAAATSIESLASKVKELEINNFLSKTIARQSLGFSLGALAPKTQDKAKATMDAIKTNSAFRPSTKRAQPAKSTPPVPAVSTEIKEIFGGIFKQETIYIDED